MKRGLKGTRAASGDLSKVPGASKMPANPPTVGNDGGKSADPKARKTGGKGEYVGSSMSKGHDGVTGSRGGYST